jgi:hypothetical protein
MPDRMTLAGRDWMEGRLSSDDYFATARREAHAGLRTPSRPSWRARLMLRIRELVRRP